MSEQQQWDAAAVALHGPDSTSDRNLRLAARYAAIWGEGEAA